MNNLFVYGSLKSEKVQKELFGKKLNMTKATLLNYGLYEAEDGFYYYGTKFDIDDIEEVAMLDNLPSGIRTNGVGVSTYNLGNFSINGYGKCKLYVYFENKNCISIKLKDNSYIFFNDKSNDKTLKYYSELEKVLEKS